MREYQKRSERGRFMNSSQFLILGFLILLTFSACKTTKTTKTPAVDAEEMKARELMKNIEAKEFSYEYLTAKTKIDYKSADRSQSVKADLRMKKDSIIWISVTPLLGLEAFRVVITPDSIHILDRLNKVYYQKPYDYIKQFSKVDLTYSMLQDIFTGGPIVFKDGKIKTTVEKNRNVLISENGELINKMYFAPSDFLIMQAIINDKNAARSIDMKYDNYETVGSSMFSHIRNINIEAEEKVNIGLEFSKVTLSNSLSFPFSVSDNYEVVK